MGARDDHAARAFAGVSEPECWAALFDEIDELRAKLNEHHAKWFYLHAHPEHAKELASEVLFDVKLERDSAGHILTDKCPECGSAFKGNAKYPCDDGPNSWHEYESQKE